LKTCTDQKTGAVEQHTVITPALPIARQKFSRLFYGYFKFSVVFKYLCIFIPRFSRKP